MITTYRAVKSNTSDDVIAVGYDENQGGQAYLDCGTWCEFTFTEFPEVDYECLKLIQEKDYNIPLYKIKDNEIVSKTIKEVQDEIAE